MSSFRVLFLLPVRSQPRYHKRIRGMMRAGCDASALYFDRPYFEGAALPCPARAMGQVEHGAYLGRLPGLGRALRQVSRAAKQVDAIYAFGLDMMLLARLAAMQGRVPTVYEIGDVRAVQLAPSVRGRIVRAVERWAVRGAAELVVTAPGFATGYLRNRLGVTPEKLHVIENRLDLPVAERPPARVHSAGDPIVVGYFGLLRCRRSWESLKALARMGDGSIRIVVRGYALGIDLQNEPDKSPWIHYGGEFVAPDELPNLYGSVDIVWGCYPAPERLAVDGSLDVNWRWARTNRFYESCYFGRPILALSGSDEAREIEALGIGMGVDLSSPTQAASQLLKVLPESLAAWQVKAAELPGAVSTYTNEHDLLAASLRRCRDAANSDSVSVRSL